MDDSVTLGSFMHLPAFCPIAESMGFKGDFRPWEHLLRIAIRQTVQTLMSATGEQPDFTAYEHRVVIPIAMLPVPIILIYVRWTPSVHLDSSRTKSQPFQLFGQLHPNGSHKP